MEANRADTGVTDSDGAPVFQGDVVSFSYGIPPISVRAKIESHDGRFYAMTPGHRPSRCPLGELMYCVGDFTVIKE